MVQQQSHKHDEQADDGHVLHVVKEDSFQVKGRVDEGLELHIATDLVGDGESLDIIKPCPNRCNKKTKYYKNTICIIWIF